jgi:hypothetical protein
MGKDGQFDVAVSFDERRGYVGTAPDLRAPVVALSLSGLRRKIEIALLPDDQRTTLPDQCLHSAEADVRPPRRKSEFDPGCVKTHTSATCEK